MFGPGCGQIEAKFDGGLEFFGMKRQAKNTISAGGAERKFTFRSDAEGDDRHFARRSDFADLAHRFDDALRTRFKTGCGKEVVGSEDHEIEIFAASLVSEFVNASGPRRADAGSVIAEVEDHYLNQVANTAIRIANQKVERFHQFVEYRRLVELATRAFAGRAKAGRLPIRNPGNFGGMQELASGTKTKVSWETTIWLVCSPSFERKLRRFEKSCAREDEDDCNYS